MKQQELLILTNVIDVARRELDDRDDKEIPAKLRRVARCADRRLPPPFKRSIIKGIVTSDGFRESVLERWRDEEIDDPVGEAFLEDPEKGIEAIAELAEAATVGSLSTDLDAAQARIFTLEKQLAEAKRRLSDVRDTHKADIASRQAAAAASQTSLERKVKELKASAGDFDAERARHSAEVAALNAEIDDLRARLDRSVSRARKKAQQSHVRVVQPSAPPTDPIELGAWLDTVERQQRGYREARRTTTETSGESEAIRAPHGLLPDSPEALAALIAQGPEVIYVDGYNVAAMLDEDFATSKVRNMVAAKADRLAVASNARVVVVFDAVGVEGRSKASPVGKAEIRFTQDQIADDEIVELVSENPGRAIVISSDRELNNRCAAVGCVTVWSEAFVAWAGR